MDTAVLTLLLPPVPQMALLMPVFLSVVWTGPAHAAKKSRQVGLGKLSLRTCRCCIATRPAGDQPIHPEFDLLLNACSLYAPR
jgi:hypothetical protein